MRTFNPYPPATPRGGARFGRTLLRTLRTLRTLLLATATAAAAAALTLTLAGCDQPAPPPEPTPAERPAVPGADEARDQLAARVAAAGDRRVTAQYLLATAGAADRWVTVTEAADGGWRVDVAGGALSGNADISVARTADGLFQCALQSAGRPDPPVCVRVADPDGVLPAPLDPEVEHVFTDWRQALLDRAEPLAVGASRPLPGAAGSCYSVDSTSAALAPPVAEGIYCYEPDGTLTAARLKLGSLRLVGAPAAAPATVTLPAPVVAADPLPITAPTLPT
ncbi:hypothetical protein ACFFWC_24025 [Plantactinospora siamensis]|uniref:Uncharacterized protein n=1 Tax=Plantactinospora siamensis TaxID=555372 RepID=A0ABV6P6Q4_9ACTN